MSSPMPFSPHHVDRLIEAVVDLAFPGEMPWPTNLSSDAWDCWSKLDRPRIKAWLDGIDGRRVTLGSNPLFDLRVSA